MKKILLFCIPLAALLALPVRAFDIEPMGVSIKDPTLHLEPELIQRTITIENQTNAAVTMQYPGKYKLGQEHEGPQSVKKETIQPGQTSTIAYQYYYQSPMEVDPSTLYLPISYRSEGCLKKIAQDAGITPEEVKKNKSFACSVSEADIRNNKLIITN